MRVTKIVPHGRQCTLKECPSGPFFHGHEQRYVGFKTEYSTDDGFPEAYCMESGEFFWGGAKDQSERASLIVQPAILEEDDE